MKKICMILVLVLAVALTASAMDWHVPGEFGTIQEAIDSSNVVDGDTILVGPGYFEGATVTKAVEIRGVGIVTIENGPFPWPVRRPEFKAGFLFSGSGVGSGATIARFRFEGVEFPVYSFGADDVTVTHCTFLDSIQAVSNWSGSRWNIDHNEIIDLRTACGGGIGIFIGELSGGIVTDNVVAHNKIYGTLHVPEDDCGGYTGAGIVLYADFRWNRLGAESVAWNRVIKNKVSLVSSNPDIVEIWAITLTEGWGDVGQPEGRVIHDNAIGFNDLRGTELQLAFTPGELVDCNKISRNLGDNRRYDGICPKVFFEPEIE